MALIISRPENLSNSSFGLGWFRPRPGLEPVLRSNLPHLHLDRVTKNSEWFGFLVIVRNLQGLQINTNLSRIPSEFLRAFW
jgi:hypothetical protein